MSAWPEAIYTIKKLKSELFNTYLSLRGSNTEIDLTTIQESATSIQSSLITAMRGVNWTSESTIITLPALQSQVGAQANRVIEVIGTTSTSTVKSRFDTLDNNITTLNSAIGSVSAALATASDALATAITNATKSKHYAIIDQVDDASSYPPTDDFISGAVCFIRT